jgi:hypothetical protein
LSESFTKYFFLLEIEKTNASSSFTKPNLSLSQFLEV